MKRHDIKLVAILLAGGFLMGGLGCEKQEPAKSTPTSPAAPTSPATPQKSAAPAEEKKPEVPASPTAAPAATATPPKTPATTPLPIPEGATALDLGGVTIMVSKDWVVEPVAPGPLAAKFAFKLPKAEGDAEDGSIRITHYPNMKGMDDGNINRWISQVKRPDGQPATKEDAKIAVTERGSVRLTIVDISGTMSGGMGTAQAGGANQRAINVIIDHPDGPHFLRASGGQATIAKWEASIRAAVDNAKAG